MPKNREKNNQADSEMEAEGLPIFRADVAGIDLGSKKHWVETSARCRPRARQKDRARRSNTARGTWSRTARPGDADGVDLQFAAEVERDPLRVTGFAGEGFRQIGIAFPVRARIAVGQARIAGSVAHGERRVGQEC